VAFFYALRLQMEFSQLLSCPCPAKVFEKVITEEKERQAEKNK
jgi:hypothetical protein